MADILLLLFACLLAALAGVAFARGRYYKNLRNSPQQTDSKPAVLLYRDIKTQCHIWMEQKIEDGCEDDSEARDWITSRFMDAIDMVMLERRDKRRDEFTQTVN